MRSLHTFALDSARKRLVEELLEDVERRLDDLNRDAVGSAGAHNGSEGVDLCIGGGDLSLALECGEQLVDEVAGHEVVQRCLVHVLLGTLHHEREEARHLLTHVLVRNVGHLGEGTLRDGLDEVLHELRHLLKEGLQDVAGTHLLLKHGGVDRHALLALPTERDLDHLKVFLVDLLVVVKDVQVVLVHLRQHLLNQVRQVRRHRLLRDAGHTSPRREQVQVALVVVGDGFCALLHVVKDVDAVGALRLEELSSDGGAHERGALDGLALDGLVLLGLGQVEHLLQERHEAVVVRAELRAHVLGQTRDRREQLLLEAEGLAGVLEHLVQHVEQTGCGGGVGLEDGLLAEVDDDRRTDETHTHDRVAQERAHCLKDLRVEDALELTTEVSAELCNGTSSLETDLGVLVGDVRHDEVRQVRQVLCEGLLASLRHVRESLDGGPAVAPVALVRGVGDESKKTPTCLCLHGLGPDGHGKAVKALSTQVGVGVVRTLVVVDAAVEPLCGRVLLLAHVLDHEGHEVLDELGVLLCLHGVDLAEGEHRLDSEVAERLVHVHVLRNRVQHEHHTRQLTGLAEEVDVAADDLQEALQDGLDVIKAVLHVGRRLCGVEEGGHELFVTCTLVLVEVHDEGHSGLGGSHLDLEGAAAQGFVEEHADLAGVCLEGRCDLREDLEGSALLLVVAVLHHSAEEGEELGPAAFACVLGLKALRAHSGDAVDGAADDGARLARGEEGEERLVQVLACVDIEHKVREAHLVISLIAHHVCDGLLQQHHRQVLLALLTIAHNRQQVRHQPCRVLLRFGEVHFCLLNVVVVP